MPQSRRSPLTRWGRSRPFGEHPNLKDRVHLVAASTDQAAAFPKNLNFSLFRHFQCVVDLDPQVAHCAFQFAMA